MSKGVRRVAAKHNPFGSADKVGLVEFTIGAENGSSVRNIGVQFKDANGNNCAEAVSCKAYLSDNADGSSLMAMAPDTVAVGTDGLAIELVSKKVWQFVSESDGHLDIDITQAGEVTCYLCIVLPDGSVKVSGAISFAA